MVKSKQIQTLVESASRELTGVCRAAIAAGHRMAALERDAENTHGRTLLSCSARVLSTPEHDVHVLLTDGKGTTVQVADGAVAVAVAKPE